MGSEGCRYGWVVTPLHVTSWHGNKSWHIRKREFRDLASEIAGKAAQEKIVLLECHIDHLQNTLQQE